MGEVVVVDVLGKYGEWVEAARELLEQDQGYFPRARVAALLDESMDASVVSWSWADENGSFGCECNRPGPRRDWTVADVADQVGCEMHQRHPLAQWFRTSGDPCPMSVGRLPRSAAPPEDFAVVEDVLGPAGLEQQLAIPYRLGAATRRAFVLSRGDDDFSDDDLDLAHRLQPLLALLERQVSVARERRTSRAAEAGLTGREVAVLALLSDGGTADAIARRLGISPRTVHNHLRHIYRKLGVDDRMRAVLAAQAMGLIRRRSGVGHGCDGPVAAPTTGDLPDEAAAPPIGAEGLHWAYLARPAEEGGPTIVQQLRPAAIGVAPRAEMTRGRPPTMEKAALSAPRV